MYCSTIFKKNFTLSFDNRTTERRVISTGSEYQLVIGSSLYVSSPEYLIAAHQTAARSGFANKAIIVSVFDHVDVRTFFVEIVGKRYPKDSVIINYATNSYLNQFSDLEIYFEEYAKEPLLKPFIT